jgi:hypothetical protein
MVNRDHQLVEQRQARELIAVRRAQACRGKRSRVVGPRLPSVVDGIRKSNGTVARDNVVGSRLCGWGCRRARYDQTDRGRNDPTDEVEAEVRHLRRDDSAVPSAMVGTNLTDC